MRNKVLAVLLCLPVLLTGILTAHAESPSVTYTVAEAQSLCDGIVAYNGAWSGQSFIDTALCSGAGTTAEFYVISLSQSGNYDFSGYESALLNYLDTHEVYSATSREKFALALAAAGSTDRYIADTADEAIGGLGIMSLDFGLHLLNNGYSSALYSVDGLISDILSSRTSDGGWAVIGSYGDVDVTAMTLQALAPYYGARGDVTSAVDTALELLSSKQQDSGAFKTMGVENCESTAQVIVALSSLGIDPQYDGRFIKNGNSAFQGMMQYYAGGGFSHTGDGANDTATMEAFCALTAYLRMCRGQGSLYVLDHVDHSTPVPDSGSASSSSSGGSSGNSSSGGSGSGSNSGSSGSGSSSRANNASSGSSSKSGDSSPEQVVTDDNGNRIVVINGQKFIEATTPSGEVVTVNVSETEAVGETASAPQKATHGGFQPSATADAAMKATADESGKGCYKPYAILGVILVGGAACAVLFLLKKRNKKHYIAVAILVAAGVLFIILTNFQSPDAYKESAVTDGDLTVTLSIRCDTITGLDKVNDFIPDDGVILDTATYSAAEGDTVYDVLCAAVSAVDMPLYNRGADGAAYIAGINCLYEFDYGELSGWMYRVNGVFPDVGCQSYYVEDGDVIEWLYTTNIGKDLGQ